MCKEKNKFKLLDEDIFICSMEDIKENYTIVNEQKLKNLISSFLFKSTSFSEEEVNKRTNIIIDGLR